MRVYCSTEYMNGTLLVPASDPFRPHTPSLHSYCTTVLSRPQLSSFRLEQNAGGSYRRTSK